MLLAGPVSCATETSLETTRLNLLSIRGGCWLLERVSCLRSSGECSKCLCVYVLKKLNQEDTYRECTQKRYIFILKYRAGRTLSTGLGSTASAGKCTRTDLVPVPVLSCLPVKSSRLSITRSNRLYVESGYYCGLLCSEYQIPL